MEDVKRFQQYKELFTRSYIENNNIECEDVTVKELETLDDLDADEVYENIHDLINGLLEFKRTSRQLQQIDLIQTLRHYEESTKSLETQLKTLVDENKTLRDTNLSLSSTVKDLKIPNAPNKIMSESVKPSHNKNTNINLLRLAKKTSLNSNSSKGLKIITARKSLKGVESRGNSNSVGTQFKTGSELESIKEPEERKGEKKQTIKSVTFEYVHGANKIFDKTVNITREKSRTQRNSDFQLKRHLIHTRSTSDGFLAFNVSNHLFS